MLLLEYYDELRNAAYDLEFAETDAEKAEARTKIEKYERQLAALKALPSSKPTKPTE